MTGLCLIYRVADYSSFYGSVTHTFHLWLKTVVTNFVAILKSFYFLHFNNSVALSDFIVTMPALNRNEKITCENCGTQFRKADSSRHKKRCTAGTLYCKQCPNFSTKSQADLNFHIAKKHSSTKPQQIHKCQRCDAVFSGFYSLRQHREKVHGAKRREESKIVNINHIAGEVDDENLKRN